jgi:riboflavin transporter FmnP
LPIATSFLDLTAQTCLLSAFLLGCRATFVTIFARAVADFLLFRREVIIRKPNENFNES